jgi:hypothetical protein
MFISDHGFGSAHEPDPYPLVRGTDPQIRIRTKMPRIRNTDKRILHLSFPHFESFSYEKNNKILTALVTKMVQKSKIKLDFFLSVRIQMFDEMGGFLRKFETTCLAR